MRIRSIVFYSTKQFFLNGKPRENWRRDYCSTVNVEKVASSLETKISAHDFRFSPRICIFTTPTVLSRHNKAAYTPTAFSIGPLHHAKPGLNRSEVIKLKYLNSLVSRCSPVIKLRDLVCAVAKLEVEARQHYSEPIKLGADELVKMFVIDGCFLIELLRKNARVLPREPDDPVFTMSCLFQHLLHDLILLENQIPWIVLECLFDLTKQFDQEKRSLRDLALDFLNEELPTDQKHLHKLARNINATPKSRHLLELLREILVSTSPKQTTKDKESWPPIPSATKLCKAGISFKKSEPGGLSISFTKGVVHISPITITETTEALFRNIISFEQCSHNCPPIFTSYAILLDNLINTPEDLEYLVKQGIINNWLNPEDATRFFNKLYHDAFVNAFYYPKLCADVKGHYQRRLPKWKTSLVSNYFCNPWVGASTIAAVLLVILTLVDTVFTILGYLRSVNHNKPVDDQKEYKPS